MRAKAEDLLWVSSVRFLVQHPWQFALSILGVALGVAMVVSIDLSNSSAQRAFSISAEAIAGKATHQIVGAGEELDEQVYRNLRVEHGFRTIAPVIEGYGRLEGLSRSFQILGVDPIAEGPFRDFSSQESGLDLAGFIGESQVACSQKPFNRSWGLVLMIRLKFLLVGWFSRSSSSALLRWKTSAQNKP